MAQTLRASINIHQGKTSLIIPDPRTNQRIRIIGGYFNWTATTVNPSLLTIRATGGQILARLLRSGVNEVQLFPRDLDGWFPPTPEGEGIRMTWQNSGNAANFCGELRYRLR